MQKNKYTIAIIALLLMSVIPAASAITINSCGTLGAAGGQYFLSQNISYTGGVGGKCLEFTGFNTTLDCNGHTIFINNSAQAIFANTNTARIIKECRIVSDGSNTTGIDVRPTNAGSFEMEIFFNTIDGGRKGIEMFDNSGSSDWFIYKNTVSNTQIGAELGVVSNEGAEFYDNILMNVTNGFVFNTFTANNLSFYNNLFNVSNVTATGSFLSGNPRKWNTSPQIRTNIIGTTAYGGNFYTSPIGSDYSDFCDDNGGDGYCDDPNVISLDNIDFLAIALGNGTINTPPLPVINFIGVDNNQNFVFTARIQDDEGGSVFEAHSVDPEGSLFNSTQRTEIIYFNVLSDLNNVDNEFCGDFLNISYNPAFTFDGALIDNKTSCVFPTDISFSNPVFESDTLGEVETSISFEFEGSSGDITSASLFDNDLNIIGQVIFRFGVNHVNVSIFNGTEVPVGNITGVDAFDRFTLKSTYNFTTDVIDYELITGFIGTLQLSFNATPIQAATSIGGYRMGELSTAAELYVDTVSYIHDRDFDFPPYQSFGVLSAGEILTKDIRAAAGDFGNYEATLYATDSGFGLSFYDTPSFTTFTYDNNTPVLSEEEIASIVDAFNEADADDFVEGDLWTDRLTTILDLTGIKTAKSRFIIGLVILITVIIAASTHSSIVGLLAGIATAIGLTVVGLWATWITATIVIIAFLLLGAAIRRQMLGGG